MTDSNRASGNSYDDIPDFGALYDAVPIYATRGDVAFYAAEARRAGGNVLELGCGTGRILRAMARAGAQVTGIDASIEMLARCRAALATESADVQARASVHHGDARDFSLAERFALIVAPFRMFQHLVGVEEQLRCLAAVARHLGPDGRFVFDVFNPSFPALVKDRTAEVEDTGPVELSDGRTMRRAYRVPKVHWVEQVSETEIIYYVALRPGAPETRYVQGFGMRWYLRAELEHLLARAGLRIEAVHGDFDRRPLADESPEMIVIAARA